LNRQVAAQGKTYRDASTADTAWAQQLLAIPGIVQLFAVNDFISVSKAPEADWSGLVPQIEAVLRQTFA
jgi:Scaffold protein Nfu/NifU N terminal